MIAQSLPAANSLFLSAFTLGSRTVAEDIFDVMEGQSLSPSPMVVELLQNAVEPFHINDRSGAKMMLQLGSLKDTLRLSSAPDPKAVAGNIRPLPIQLAKASPSVLTALQNRARALLGRPSAESLYDYAEKMKLDPLPPTDPSLKQSSRVFPFLPQEEKPIHNADNALAFQLSFETSLVRMRRNMTRIGIDLFRTESEEGKKMEWLDPVVVVPVAPTQLEDHVARVVAGGALSAGALFDDIDTIFSFSSSSPFLWNIFSQGGDFLFRVGQRSVYSSSFLQVARQIGGATSGSGETWRRQKTFVLFEGQYSSNRVLWRWAVRIAEAMETGITGDKVAASNSLRPVLRATYGDEK